MTRLTRPVRNDGDEQDVFTRWRRFLILRPGYIRRVKRRANKRNRQEAKEQIREGKT